MNAEERAEIVETIASELLPKLVSLLQDIQPEYRQRTIDAAMILLKEPSDNG